MICPLCERRISDDSSDYALEQWRWHMKRHGSWEVYNDNGLLLERTKL